MESIHNVQWCTIVVIYRKTIMKVVKSITQGLALFKAGKRLANPAPWKTVQAATGLLIPVVIAAIGLAEANGIQLGGLDAEVVAGMVAGFGVSAYGLFNTILTVITTNKIGVSGSGED